MSDVIIESIETFQLSAPLDRSFGYAQGWVDERVATIVRVQASDGTVGWGECFGPLAGTADVIDELLAPALHGEDPRQVPPLYETMYDLCRRSYQTTVPLPAISGVDIALWDVRARLAGTSVADVLGGRFREAVPAYATGHYFRPTSDLTEQYTAITEEATTNAQELGALKIKLGLDLLGHDADADIELARRIVEAVPAETTVMADANYAYDRPTAERVGRELAALGIRWFEEPIPPENEAGYRRLQRTLAVPIAGGECLSPAAFDRLLEREALDVVQPDVCAGGGITPARRIATRALQYGRSTVVPHVWGTPIGQAASLHLLATLPTAPWVEWDRSPNPLREELVGDPPSVDDNGHVSIPDGSGLGVSPQPAALEAFAD